MKNYFVVDGEVVVEPVVPPLPTVPELEPPMPLLPAPVLVPAPALPVPLVEPVEPEVPEAPVLELSPRSSRHLSFCAWSVSFSQLARAEALSVVLPVTPVELDESADPDVPAEPDALGEVVVPDALEPEAVPDAPAELDESVEGAEDVDGVAGAVDGVDDVDGVVLMLGLDGEVVLELPLVVWATATDVAARKAAATAA